MNRSPRWLRPADLAAAAMVAAQRRNVRLPRVLRVPLRAALQAVSTRQQGDAQVIDGWDRPLIGDRADLTEVAGRGLDPGARSVVGPPRQEAASSGASAPADLDCLLVTGSLDAGGMDEVVAFLALRLPRFGVRTAILHTSSQGRADGTPTGRLGRQLLAAGVETLELDAAAGADWLARRHPEVISAHGAQGWVLDRAVELGIPYLDTLHGMHSLFGADWSAESDRAAKLTGIVTVSELNRRQYLEGNPSFPPERILTIPNGVDDERRSRADRRAARGRLGLDDEFLFVSLARHCLQKNSYALVSAFEEVAASHPKAHLLIAGRPDERDYFAQVLRLRAGLRHGDRIHLRDHTTDPAQVLAASDAFVLNSFFEGWPLASMEALFAGIPVILSEMGGAVEQVGLTGERGLVVPNPVGDPLAVDWVSMRRLRYADQTNRPELVSAMREMVDRREEWAARRESLSLESAQRFDPDVCVRSHSQSLRRAALAEPVGVSSAPDLGRR